MRYLWVIAGLAFAPALGAQAQVAYPPGVSQPQLDAVAATIPAGPTASPPAVTDSGSMGTQTMVYALANHTHASKVRRGRATSAADGTITATFSPAFNSPPVCVAVAEVASGVTDVVNVQIIGTPTTTSANLLVNRTNRSVVALIGLTVLSVPSSPGATVVHWACIEP